MAQYSFLVNKWFEKLFSQKYKINGQNIYIAMENSLCMKTKDPVSEIKMWNKVDIHHGRRSLILGN